MLSFPFPSLQLLALLLSVHVESLLSVELLEADRLGILGKFADFFFLVLLVEELVREGLLLEEGELLLLLNVCRCGMRWTIRAELVGVTAALFLELSELLLLTLRLGVRGAPTALF